MRSTALLLVVCLAAACGNSGQASNQTQPPATTGAVLPADVVILDGTNVQAMLRQCSRMTPATGESSWLPSPADVAALEAALPAALAAAGRAEVRGAPRGWRRQYVGIVRGGRRFIYGNFLPFGPENDEIRPDPQRWRQQPEIICDGGPAFFGVEYDVEARRFTQIAFNGAI
jgi:hypothetical protein